MSDFEMADTNLAQPNAGTPTTSGGRVNTRRSNE